MIEGHRDLDATVGDLAVVVGGVGCGVVVDGRFVDEVAGKAYVDVGGAGGACALVAVTVGGGDAPRRVPGGALRRVVEVIAAVVAGPDRLVIVEQDAGRGQGGSVGH